MTCAAARLEALPDATLCIDCADASEAPTAFDLDE
jgi:RNA polymerase-binding transcription factor DksA